MIDKSKSIEEQAHEAFDLRNTFKHDARAAMSDETMARYLDYKYPVPSFEKKLEDKMKRKGLTREEALRDIIKTASKTNIKFDKGVGL